MRLMTLPWFDVSGWTSSGHEALGPSVLRLVFDDPRLVVGVRVVFEDRAPIEPVEAREILLVKIAVAVGVVVAVTGLVGPEIGHVARVGLERVRGVDLHVEPGRTRLHAALPGGARDAIEHFELVDEARVVEIACRILGHGPGLEPLWNVVGLGRITVRRRDRIAIGLKRRIRVRRRWLLCPLALASAVRMPMTSETISASSCSDPPSRSARSLGGAGGGGGLGGGGGGGGEGRRRRARR